ncbi:pentapeptide repeat-containing protein [Halioxenophilus aromaticivorans]|uniref:Pentapeptide repeat-containing protein n=1 Tax=Halioxenophilus aromaticivorans TaxID=1306992 RepID=A0AAV3U591_9ALTE
MNIKHDQNYQSQTFSGEDFTGQRLSAVEFSNCTFDGCDFSDAIFSRCIFSDCTFLKCNLSLVKMDYSKLDEIAFKECKLVGVDWAKVAWPRLILNSPVAFHDCLLSESSFYGLALSDLVLEGCIARNVDFREGDFNGANFTNTDFSGAMFAETNLSKVDFCGASEFDIDLFSNKLKQAKFDRFEAVRLLGSLEIELV